METDQARANVKALLQGKTPRRELSLAEAKARLRATDPAIDISAPLRHLNRGDMKKAGITLVAETATVVTLPYLRPVVTATLYGLHDLLTGKTRQLSKKS